LAIRALLRVSLIRSLVSPGHVGVLRCAIEANEANAYVPVILAMPSALARQRSPSCRISRAPASTALW
jgi:hypothetical protein